MRSRIVLLPGALEREGEVPLLELLGEPLAQLASRSALTRIAAVPSAVPELQWLGLPSRDIAPGVLTIAALNADPPDRSVHFHLSVLSLTDGRISQVPYLPTPAEQAQLISAAKKLETSRLSLVEGRGLDHGLVWEDGSIELETASPVQAEERGFADSLPEGDGEPLLRRFIDDSVNLLHELEWNQMREEEGLPPINLLWPWGPGFRPRLPNLPLERGRIAQVESPSLRLSGLCRLVGYRHGDPWTAGTGTNLRLESMAANLMGSDLGVALIPTLGEFRSDNRHEELAWFGREFSPRLLGPLIAKTESDPSSMSLIAWDREGKGLALRYAPRTDPEEQTLPFSAESTEEKRLAARSLEEFMAEEMAA